jgi:AcrR family transcriptional regulator
MTKDDVRDHILQVAGPIFAAEGYQATTGQKIWEAAQVNVSAVAAS